MASTELRDATAAGEDVCGASVGNVVSLGSVGSEELTGVKKAVDAAAVGEGDCSWLIDTAEDVG